MHAVLHRATTGIALSVAFELVYAVLFKLWAMATTGTAMPAVFEPVHAALNKLRARAKTGTKMPVVSELVHAAPRPSLARRCLWSFAPRCAKELRVAMA